MECHFLAARAGASPNEPTVYGVYWQAASRRWNPSFPRIDRPGSGHYRPSMNAQVTARISIDTAAGKMSRFTGTPYTIQSISRPTITIMVPLAKLMYWL